MLDLPDMRDYEEARRAFRLEIPEHYNFAFDVVHRRATERDGVAYVFVDALGERVTRRTFGDLDRSSNRVVRMLGELGARRGDRVFLMLPRIPAFYDVVIGCIKAGVVAMPGTNLLRPKDIQYRVERAGARFAVVTAEHADKIERIRDACPTLEHVILVGAGRPGWVDYDQTIDDFPDTLPATQRVETRSDELMLLYFTSGTTAFPKMVPRDHGYALAHAITGKYWMDLREGDVHWTLTDTGWAKAAWGLLFPPWLMGATTVLYEGASRFDPDFHLKLIGELGVTTFCAPPTIYRLFAQQDLSRYDLSSLRHSIGAGEPLNPEAIRVWHDATGTVPLDGYGQTETVNVVANFPAMEVRPGSMGKPVPGVDVAIVDDDGAELPAGEVGHIAVRLTDPWPPGLFRGYWKDDEANARCFRNGWYYTGDTATRDDDGYLWFVGRADDVISSSSYRISPFEVESALQEHPAVAENAVVGKPDPTRGEIVKAYVVLAQGFEPSDDLAREIQDFVKEQTAPYKYPREIVFRAELPKTISGKIRRVELRAEARIEGRSAR